MPIDFTLLAIGILPSAKSYQEKTIVNVKRLPAVLAASFSCFAAIVQDTVFELAEVPKSQIVDPLIF